jgi:hypothetical protein
MIRLGDRRHSSKTTFAQVDSSILPAVVVTFLWILTCLRDLRGRVKTPTAPSQATKTDTRCKVCGCEPQSGGKSPGLAPTETR